MQGNKGMGKKKNEEMVHKIVSIKRTDKLHSPTGLHNGFMIEFNDEVDACMEEAMHYGIKISKCELWCSEDSVFGKWITKKLDWLYYELEGDARNGDIQSNG